MAFYSFKVLKNWHKNLDRFNLQVNFTDFRKGEATEDCYVQTGINEMWYFRVQKEFAWEITSRVVHYSPKMSYAMKY